MDNELLNLLKQKDLYSIALSLNNPDYSLILGDANVFFKTFKLLEQKMVIYLSKDDYINFSMCMISSFVNGAMACELALKSFMKKNNIPIPTGSDGHKINKLLDQCLEIKAMIYFLCNNFLNMDNEVIKNEILNISNTFVDWRYYYEKNNIKMNVQFFTYFVNNLCEIILKGK